MRARRAAIAVAFMVGCTASTGELPSDPYDDTVDDGKSDAATAQIAQVHRFADSQLHPEGGALDPRTGDFYVGSLTRSTITKVSATGVETEIYASGDPETLTLGMQVDSARNQLWVCTTRDSLGSVWVFDLATQKRTATIDLTALHPEAACNDVLIKDDGTVLVSDRENPYIYQIDAAGRASVWAHDPLLKGRVISLNSMAFSADGRYVLTAPYLPASLVRISVDNPADVRKVELTGAMFMDGVNLLNGPDDLIEHDGQLLVAFGSTMKRVVPNRDWTRAEVYSTRTIGGVTALMTDGERVFAMNGQSVRFALKLSPKPFVIFEVFASELN